MKKWNIWYLILLCTILVFTSNENTAYAYSQEPAPNEAGYPAYVSIRLMRQSRTGSNVHEIFFYNIETGVEYYVEFSPFNFKHETIWFEYINLPLGTYEITGGVYQDVGAKYSLYTDNSLLTLTEGVQEISCIIGDREWLEENKAWKWDVAEYDATLPTPTPTYIPEPSTEPVPTITVEDSEGHIIYITTTPTPIITNTPTPVPTIPPIPVTEPKTHSMITSIMIWSAIILFVFSSICLIKKMAAKKQEDRYYDEPENEDNKTE